MIKKLVSLSVGAALLLSPILVSAQTAPNIIVPPGATILQLQTIIQQLTQILTQLLAQKQTKTQTTSVGPVLTIAAGTQPVNSLAPQNAFVGFTTFTITNTGSFPATIDGVTVQNSGMAPDAVFSGIELGSDGVPLKTIQRSNGSLPTNYGISHGVNFSGLGITLQPGQFQTLTVSGIMANSNTAYAGQTARLSIIGINTSATVSGSLPYVGATHTINATLNVCDANGQQYGYRCATPTNNILLVYVGTTLLYQQADMTQGDALAKCKSLAAQYSALTGRCAWGTTEIYTQSAPTPPSSSSTTSQTTSLSNPILTSSTNTTSPPAAPTPSNNTLLVYVGAALVYEQPDMTQADALTKCKSLAAQYPSVSGYCLWGSAQIYSTLPTSPATNTLLVYAGSMLAYQQASMTQVDALAKCKALGAQYPTVSGYCTWGGTQIYSTQTAAPITNTLIIYANGTSYYTQANMTKDEALAKCKSVAAQYPGFPGYCTWGGATIASQGKTSYDSTASQSSQMASALVALQGALETLIGFLKNPSQGGFH